MMTFWSGLHAADYQLSDNCDGAVRHSRRRFAIKESNNTLFSVHVKTAMQLLTAVSPILPLQSGFVCNLCDTIEYCIAIFLHPGCAARDV
jgi:hypothetical protein